MSSSNTQQRLHAWSWIFYLGGALKEVAVPFVVFLFMGRKEGAWSMVGLGFVVLFAVWTVLRARAYRYQVGQGELLVREGLLDRTQRHIPFARIQSVSQRSKFLHRLLGVTELRLESAAGGKPEAVMKVLGLSAAAELEALLRQEHLAAAAPVGHAGPTESNGPQLLHQLPFGEILRLGLISNKGMILVAAGLGVILPNATIRRTVGNAMQPALQGLRAHVQMHDWQFVVVVVLVLLLLVAVVVRLLSVAMAVLKYHRFRLQLQDGKLLVERGLSTQVRTGARLARLQSWTLEESWLHRRFKRCRLGVSVAGNSHSQEGGVEPGSLFNEMAPIATPAQAQHLLAICLPALDWGALQWQPLHANTRWRKVLGQLRFWLPTWLGLLWAMDMGLGWSLPISGLLVATVLPVLGLVWYAWAWTRFAAYAQFTQGTDQVVLFRSGVWNKRWVIVVASRLQTLRLYSSALDRRLGLVNLIAHTHGGARRSGSVAIPCLSPSMAEALRSMIWAQQR